VETLAIFAFEAARWGPCTGWTPHTKGYGSSWILETA
jgi:hypothetical protein